MLRKAVFKLLGLSHVVVAQAMAQLSIPDNPAGRTLQ